MFAALRARAEGGSVALGVDLPFGLPRAYVERHPGAADFPAFLRGLAHRPDFFRVCAALDEVSAARPFYPLRNGPGMTRAGHAAALGLESAAGCYRACDRATADRPAGSSLFWTLGPQQVGKAALAAWRDLVLPALAAEPCVLRIWPFDGHFRDLLAPGSVAIAETYPAEALRHLGVRFVGSKRRQSDRARLAPAFFGAMAALDATPDDAMAAQVADGFGADPAGEDRFDTVLGLLCVLNVLAGRRPDGVPDDPWVRRWEGWVLGQAYPA
ncbi:MAG TPA: hypothetical protein VHS58_06840 [Acetobacteraceae bacterium]|nr:hypothetical protein [Acetobacteraceae bacterium]